MQFTACCHHMVRKIIKLFTKSAAAFAAESLFLESIKKVGDTFKEFCLIIGELFLTFFQRETKPVVGCCCGSQQECQKHT